MCVSEYRRLCATFAHICTNICCRRVAIPIQNIMCDLISKDKIICHLLQSNNLKSSVWIQQIWSWTKIKKSGWCQFKWQGGHCGAHLSQGGSFGPRPRGVLMPPIKREMPALQWRYIVSKSKMVKSEWYFPTVCSVKDTKPMCNHHGTPLNLGAHWRHKVSLIDIVPGKGTGFLGLFLEAFISLLSLLLRISFLCFIIKIAKLIRAPG